MGKLKLKLWEVDFEPLWPVGNCLIISAETKEEAMKIAAKTVYTTIHKITEIPMNEPGVVVGILNL